MTDPNLYESVRQSLPADARERIVWLALVRCFNSIERVLMRFFAQEYNSSLPRYDVLTALALHRQGLTMGDLAAMMMVTKGNITGVVRRLKQEKLVLTATSATDRRVQRVRISARGLRLWEKMHADYDRIIADLLAGQAPGELDALVTALRRTRQLAEENAGAIDS